MYTSTRLKVETPSLKDTEQQRRIRVLTHVHRASQDCDKKNTQRVFDFFRVRHVQISFSSWPDHVGSMTESPNNNRDSKKVKRRSRRWTTEEDGIISEYMNQIASNGK